MYRYHTLRALASFGFITATLGSPHIAAAGGQPVTTRAANAPVHDRKVISMSPLCLVAGQKSWAHITLTHVRSGTRVEFIWAPAKGISLGPGYGPGIFQSGAHEAIHITALAPNHYGQGTVGPWVLAAEWPKAAHAFARLSFRIVGRQSDC